MATGSVSVSITIPVNNAPDPNNVGRMLAVQGLQQAAQAIGSNLSTTSGNITVANGTGSPTSIGTWSFTAGT